MNYQTITKSRERRGVAVIVVLVCLAVVMALVVSWVKTAVLERRQLRALEDQAQAVWLAESGIERAAWQLLVNPAYAGETWQIAAAELGGQRGGVVTIRIDKPAAEAESDAAHLRTVVVTADFPAQSEHRARHSKQLNLTLSRNGDNQ